MKKILVGILTTVLIGIVAAGCTESVDVDVNEVVEKLQEFTEVEKEDDKYLFTYSEENEKIWTLKYFANNVVEFYDNAVYTCLTQEFGEDCFYGNNSGFIYDMSENAVRVYVDVEMSDGNLSIINYDFDDEKLTVNMDGGRYYASDYIEEVYEDYGIIEIMGNNVKTFKEQLEINGLLFEEVAYIEYEELKEIME